MRYHRIRSSKFNPSVAVWASAQGLWLVATFAGCAGNIQTTATGEVGGRVSDIVVRDAQFTFDGPIVGDTVYQPGDNAALQFTIVNEGDRADRLVSVTSPQEESRHCGES